MFNMSDLEGALSDAILRRLAGTGSYQRGAEYYRDGRVESVREIAGGIKATVRGTHAYSVELTSDGGLLDYACECPHAGEGAFCKHCVAVALAWIHRGANPPGKRGRGKAKRFTLDDAEKVLHDVDHQEFVRTVIGWAEDDEELRERLLVFAARRSGLETGVEAVRKAFKAAVSVYGFVPYRAVYSWVRGVEEAIDNIASLLEDKQASAVVDLCESALKELVAAMGSIDDSDGHLSTLRDLLHDIHFRACEEARPDPVSLAKRLLRFELQSDLDVFWGAAETYAGILGAKGLKEYRRLAEAEWAKVPPKTAKSERGDSMQHFRITHIMESLARAAGEIEELVAVMSRDLSSAYDYLKIARVYLEAGQRDKALVWAEKGLKAFPRLTDRRLREFAAEEYHRLKRHDDAMKLVWAEFSERPFLETYLILEVHARQASAWPEWRERALDEIRQRILKARESSKGQIRDRWARQDDHSVLVEIFLHEGDLEAAWREAQEGGCSERLWLRLAECREQSHPEDAAPIYLRHAEEAVAGERGSRYEDAVELLVKAAAAMKRADRSVNFERQLEALRLKYKIKRNFIKLLDKNQKSLYLK